MNNEIIITNHEPQDINITQDDNQLIFINGGGEVIGITDVFVNGTSVVTNNIAYVIVPTKTSQLQNNSGFITSETDPSVPNYVKAITLADINNWNSKQNALVSGTNIKTINNESLLGNGNINITGTEYTAGNGIDITNNVITNTITSYDDLTDTPTIPEKVSDLTNDLNFVTENELSEVAFTGSYASLSNTPENLSEFTNDVGFIDNTVDDLVNYTTTTDMNTALSSKQNTLVSGTNIKTINNNSILGSGDLTIGGGTSTDIQINGTSIVNNNVANIITESAYNSNTNKIATMNDLNSIIESGTFTPIIKGSTSDGNINYTIQNGIYTKIGNIVFYDFKIGLDSITNASGLLEIHGLPYMYNQINNASSVNSIIVDGDLFSGNTIRLLWNGSHLCLTDSNNGLGAMTISNTSNNNYLYSTGFYFVN